MNHILSVILWIFRNLIWLNILFAILLVFFERRNPTSTWLWLMALAFLPGLGFILYLFFGQDLSKKKLFQSTEEDFCFRELVDQQTKEMNLGEYLYNNHKYLRHEDQIRMNLISAKSFFTQDNKIDIYLDGDEKFEALIESIRGAKSYIFLEYYIFKSDGLGKIIIHELMEKAKEGVEVKVLIDGMGGRRFLRRYIRKLEEAGAKVGVFLPAFIPYLSPRINYRNHRKICIIDGMEAYIGGFNIGDEYIGLSRKFGYWRDTHLKIKGSSVASLEWRFFLDWKFVTGEELTICKSFLVYEKDQGSSGVQIVSSGPDSKLASIRNGYLKMISSAREKLYIQSPYFIPDDSIYEALRLAGLSGIDVRIMIPNKPDHLFVYWAGMSYIGDLLKVGVKFYTYEKGFLHSKVMIMDDFVSSVGTANIDMRSFHLNFEVNAFVYDQNINKVLTQAFYKDLEVSKEITLESYRNRGRIIKIKESFSRLLSPML